MNQNQRIIILAGAAVVALMILIPPWKTTKSVDLGRAGYESALRGTRAPEVGYDGSVVYAPIFSPPNGAGRSEAERFLESMGVFSMRASLHFPRLLLQIAVVILVSGVPFFMLRSRTG